MFLVHETDAEPYALEMRTTRLLIGPASGSRAITHNVSYFSPGHAPGHIHDPEEEVFYVDAGEGEVWIDGVPYALGPGSVVHTPMGVEHNVHVTSATEMRIVGSFSPHVIPGRYPNLPARSRDLAEPPANTATFVWRVDPAVGPALEPLVATERMTLALRRLAATEAVDPEPDGDLLFHVLAGTATVTSHGATYRLRPGSVLLLRPGDQATVTAVEALRLLEVAAVEAG